MGRRLRFSHDFCLQVNAEVRGLPPPSDGDKTHSLREATSQPDKEAEVVTMEKNRVPEEGEDEGEDAAQCDPDDPSFDVYQSDFTTARPDSSTADSIPKEDSICVDQMEDSCGGFMVLDQVE